MKSIARRRRCDSSACRYSSLSVVCLSRAHFSSPGFCPSCTLNQMTSARRPLRRRSTTRLHRRRRRRGAAIWSAFCRCCRWAWATASTSSALSSTPCDAPTAICLTRRRRRTVGWTTGRATTRPTRSSRSARWRGSTPRARSRSSAPRTLAPPRHDWQLPGTFRWLPSYVSRTIDGVISAHRWGLCNHWGVSVYVTYCSCSNNTVSRIRFTGKN